MLPHNFSDLYDIRKSMLPLR